ncbi:SCO2521 family protein [Actinomadura adrarensis]|uniref:SCO2521 family protein n=1 Tax=Actinomadura adrarensis TaxID=1819600 RepID=A0ABW3CTD5_9ACTN
MSSRTGPETGGTDRELTFGAVRTGLLLHSTAVTQELAAELLGFVPGEQVRQARRPMGYAISPEILTGVDCDLPSRSGSRVRGIGTFASTATITGGRVLQGSSCARVRPAGQDYRMPWSHYLARPGAVEAVGRLNTDDVADGFASGRSRTNGPLVAQIADHVMSKVQSSPLLDGRRPFSCPRTTLRWTLETPPPGPDTIDRIHFAETDSETRTLRLVLHGGRLPLIRTFVENLALHDWLLTVLRTLVEKAAPGTGGTDKVVARLRPAIDHILHLWMPEARIDQTLRPFWQDLESHSGLTAQWKLLENRIRDQVALAILSRQGTTPSTAEHHDPPRTPHRTGYTVDRS